MKIDVTPQALFDYIILAAKQRDFENVIYFAETAKEQYEKWNAQNSVAKTENQQDEQCQPKGASADLPKRWFQFWVKGKKVIREFTKHGECELQCYYLYPTKLTPDKACKCHGVNCPAWCKNCKHDCKATNGWCRMFELQ